MVFLQRDITVWDGDCGTKKIRVECLRYQCLIIVGGFDSSIFINQGWQWNVIIAQVPTTFFHILFFAASSRFVCTRLTRVPLLSWHMIVLLTVVSCRAVA